MDRDAGDSAVSRFTEGRRRRKRSAGNVKHVFVVHSPILGYVTEAVVAELGLPPEDIIVLRHRVGRALEPELPYRIRDLRDDPWRTTPIMRTRRLWRTWRQLRHFDEDVRVLVGDAPFHLYLPHSWDWWHQLLSTHTLCRGLSYLEEGFAAYCADMPFAPLKPVWQLSRLQRRLLGSRIQGDVFFSPMAGAAYGVHRESFDRTPFKRVLVSPQWRVVPRLAETFDDAALLILGPFDAAGRAESDTGGQLSTLGALARILRDAPFRQIYVRPHPNTSREYAERVMTDVLTGLGDRVALDPMTHAAETVCASSRVTVISAGSSVGVYAAILGCPSLSFAELYAEMSPTFSKRWAAIVAAGGARFKGPDIRTCAWVPTSDRVH